MQEFFIQTRIFIKFYKELYHTNINDNNYLELDKTIEICGACFFTGGEAVISLFNVLHNLMINLYAILDIATKLVIELEFYRIMIL